MECVKSFVSDRGGASQIEKVEKKLAFGEEVRYNFSIVHCWDGTVGSAIDS